MIWEPIKGYEGLYEVSEHGVIRSCARYIKTNIRHVETRLIEGRFLKQSTKRNGYKTVDLCKEGKVKTVLVHRIVATAFCPNPNGYRFVNHIDSNRANNDSCNLEWVSSSENRMHGITQGNVTFRAKPIKCIENGMKFDRPQHAAEWIKANHPERINGSIRVAAQNIRSACKGLKHTAYGFTWEYHEGSTTIPEGSRAKRPEMGDPSQEGEDIV
jgi:hypothetical protein